MEKIYRLEVVELVHKGLKQSSGLKRLKGLPVLIKEYNNGWYTGWYTGGPDPRNHGPLEAPGVGLEPTT